VTQPPGSKPLVETLQDLAQNRETGVLQVSGAEGWKVLEIKAGAISLVTGVQGKRLRLGEILIARGKASREDVLKALDVQRRTGQPLGDILVRRGAVTRRYLQEIVRFQVEEEIYELFTWRDAGCTFQRDATLGGQLEEYPDAATLFIDPQRVFAEAVRRIPVWQDIQRHIHSKHLCFELTERGQKMLSTATRGARQLLEYVKEGYSVNTIVRKSMVGRFPIWKALSDLVDGGAIHPIPDAHLAHFVQEWESKGKHEEALGVVRRLMEITHDAGALATLQGKAASLEAEVQRRIEEEEKRFEKAPAGAHPQQSRRWTRTAAVFLLLGGILAAAAYAITSITGQVGEGDIGPYRRAKMKATELESQSKRAEAIEVWDRMLATYPEGVSADLARPARARLKEGYEREVQLEINRAKSLADSKQYNEAIALCEETVRRYTLTEKGPQIAEVRAAAAKERDEYLRKLTIEDLSLKLTQGLDHLAGGRYTQAREALVTAADPTVADKDLRQKAQQALKKIDEVAAKASSLLSDARGKEELLQLDEAIEVYRQCTELWPDSEWGRIAAARYSSLEQMRRRAEVFLERGVSAHSRGDFVDATQALREAAKLKGFRFAEKAEEKLADIREARERSEALIRKAEGLKAEGRLDEAFGAIIELIERFPQMPAAKEQKLDVVVETVPPGAEVLWNGRRIGRSPATARIGPMEPGRLMVAMRGFTAINREYSKVRERVLRITLQKEIAFSHRLDAPVAAGPVPMGDGVVLRAGRLVVACDPSRGRLLWQHELAGSPGDAPGPAFLDGTVYAISGEGSLVALDASSGERRFEVPLPSKAATSPWPVRVRLLANQAFVLVGLKEGLVASISTVDRRVRWAERIKTPVSFDLAVTDRAVFVSSGGDEILALDVRTGSKLWPFRVVGGIACAPALDPSGEMLAFLSTRGGAYVLDPNGNERFRVILDEVRGGGIAVDGDICYVAGDDGAVRAFQIGTKRLTWSTDVGSPVCAGPLVHGGSVYVGTDEGELVCLQAASGQIEWQLRTGSPLADAPAAVGGRLVFGTRDGDVVGIEAGSQNTPPP